MDSNLGRTAGRTPLPPPGQTQGAVVSNQPQIGGEPVVPALLVFGEGSKRSLKQFLKPLMEGVPFYLNAVTMGKPRYEVHCAQSQLSRVHGLMPQLSKASSRIKIFEERGKPVAKAAQAGWGLANASKKAGVCRYKAAGNPCPYEGRCRFICN